MSGPEPPDAAVLYFCTTWVSGMAVSLRCNLSCALLNSWTRSARTPSLLARDHMVRVFTPPPPLDGDWDSQALSAATVRRAVPIAMTRRRVVLVIAFLTVGVFRG